METTWEHRSILPCITSSGSWWLCNCVGNIFLALFGLLHNKLAMFKCHSLTAYHCMCFLSLCDHIVSILRRLLPAGWKTMLQIKNINTSMSSLYSDALLSHQISIHVCCYHVNKDQNLSKVSKTSSGRCRASLMRWPETEKLTLKIIRIWQLNIEKAVPKLFVLLITQEMRAEVVKYLNIKRPFSLCLHVWHWLIISIPL